jgi:SpoIID/LytB domain protein
MGVERPSDPNLVQADTRRAPLAHLRCSSMRTRMRAIGSTYHRISAASQRRLPAVGAALAALVAILLVWAGSAATAAEEAAASNLVIVGAGNGHGVGMSQEGTLGYAEHGYDYRSILAHYYTGTAIGQAPPHTRVRLLLKGKVRRIALETYVRGVVGAEMPASWPLAALEAQAVASRTYALTAHAGGSKFDVYSDTRSQVYLGRAAESDATDRAVAATAGQIVTYGGQLAATFYFASSGGHTENVEDAFAGSPADPWLRGVADPFDGGPLHSWRLSFSFTAAAARLKGLVRGSLLGVEVLRRGDVSPRILSAAVLGSAGTTPVSGSELATRLGLYDSWAYFSVQTGQSVEPEPDRSGQSTSPPVSGEAPAAAAEPSVPMRAQGGSEAPGANGGTLAR